MSLYNSMPSLSIVIPTHNRPELLVESIDSALNSCGNIVEILVIDDGSQPSVDVAPLQRKFGDIVRIHRNEQALGTARVRVQGSALAKGEFMFQLDDDDLLAADSLDTAMQRLIEHDLDVIYIGVKGFGQKDAHFDRSQTRGVSQVPQRAKAYSVDDDDFFLFEDLFVGLLTSTPSAFQHPLCRTRTWRDINALRYQAFAFDFTASQGEPADALIDPLNESEWAIYAAAQWKVGFINAPFYLARCEGERNYSRPELYEKHVEANLLMKKRLLNAAENMEALGAWRQEVHRSYFQTKFDTAYHAFFNGESRFKVWSVLLDSLKSDIRLQVIKFSIRTLLPRKVHNRP